MVTRDEIRERLKTDDNWVTTSWTALMSAVPDRVIRYVVGIWVSGNRQSTSDIQISLLPDDGTLPDDLEGKFSTVPVAPADVVQIPLGGVSVEDPVVVCPGGSCLYGKVTGISLNTTIEYWDDNI